MYDTPTLILKRMEEEGRTQTWLAKQLRVTRQTMGGWLRGEEPVPRPRQAQIAVTLNIQAVTYFDRKGFAIPTR